MGALIALAMKQITAREPGVTVPFLKTCCLCVLLLSVALAGCQSASEGKKSVTAAGAANAVPATEPLAVTHVADSASALGNRRYHLVGHQSEVRVQSGIPA